MNFALRYAARSDVGQRRKGNEDSAYASQRILAVADGMGGYEHGEVASSAVIKAIAALDADGPTGPDLLGAIENAVHAANQQLHDMVADDPDLKGMGTTLTAMLREGREIALVHVGDSRAYLLRGGELYQITHDHTFVQSLVDEGRITLAEAATHPYRSLLMRTLDGTGAAEPDLELRHAELRDRYLLCSDGLTGVVGPEELRATLSSGNNLDEIAQRLIQAANEGGGPDNITCVIADVIEAEVAPGDQARFVGAVEGDG
jgi:protein phosphatase